MSDNLIDVLGEMLNSAQKNSTVKPQKRNRWRHCVALAITGWKATACKNTSDSSDDVIIKWEKNGELDIKIRLSYTEQFLWLNYMEEKR